MAVAAVDSVVGVVEGSVVGSVVGVVEGSVVGFVVGVVEGSVVGFVVGAVEGSVIGFVVGSVVTAEGSASVVAGAPWGMQPENIPKTKASRRNAEMSFFTE